MHEPVQFLADRQPSIQESVLQTATDMEARWTYMGSAEAPECSLVVQQSSLCGFWPAPGGGGLSATRPIDEAVQSPTLISKRTRLNLKENTASLAEQGCDAIPLLL
jgi:hypothetical protein